ncbi:MAG TPA: MBL fold metallo-hydrolase [Candidatus Limnocylindrales bacterium]|nr:MBL fold metallo-hydrolase [Candidatus Limnocylindrales bacterium]
MRLQFLGAAQTVTGSQYLLTTDQARVVVDCGMFQGPPAESARNREGFAYDPAKIDAVLLTHAHLDHCGMLPALVKAGYRGPIHATRATAELARLVLLDSGKLQVEHAQAHQERLERQARREEARREASNGDSPTTTTTSPTQGRHHGPGAAAAERGEPGRHWDTARFPRGGSDPERPPAEASPYQRAAPKTSQGVAFEPLYDVDDAERTLELFQGCAYEQALDVAPGIRAVFHDAGHILGSAIIVVEVTEGSETRRLVFSGDLGPPNTPILRDPTAILDGADYVLCESTYGGREHEPAQESLDILAQTVGATATSSGVLLIPSFAIGRTQDLLWYLDRLLAAGKIPHLPLYVDSPMASKATAVYRTFTQDYDAEARALMHDGQGPLDYPGVEFTDSVEASKAIAHKPRPMMIVSASGMLTGGRIVHHLANLLDDPDATILFVGYQGEGTLGAELQGGATTIHLNGQERAVRCKIRSVSGFSAHADENELVAWLEAFSRAPRRPRRIFLVHGDPDAEAALSPRVSALGLVPHTPRWKETVEL